MYSFHFCALFFFFQSNNGFIEHRVPLPGLKICLVIYGNAHNYILLAYFKGPRGRSLVKVESELTACVQIEPTSPDWLALKSQHCLVLSCSFKQAIMGPIDPV